MKCIIYLPTYRACLCICLSNVIGNTPTAGKKKITKKKKIHLLSIASTGRLTTVVKADVRRQRITAFPRRVIVSTRGGVSWILSWDANITPMGVPNRIRINVDLCRIQRTFSNIIICRENVPTNCIGCACNIIL